MNARPRLCPNSPNLQEGMMAHKDLYLNKNRNIFVSKQCNMVKKVRRKAFLCSSPFNIGIDQLTPSVAL